MEEVLQEEKKITTLSVKEILLGLADREQPITVHGWIRTRRDSKAGFSFLELYDGSSIQTLQCIAKETLTGYKTEILRLTTGCSLQLTGRVIASPNPQQPFELHVEAFTVLGWVEAPDTYPMSAKRHSLEHLREFAHLRPRTHIMGAIARIRHRLAQTIHQFFDKKGFYWIAAPIITAADCEGAGELFRVSTLDINHLPRKPDGQVDFDKDFFGKETFLSVSGQLNAEAYACALSKVYTFGPTFRAENSNTSRHLAEFWMVEPEMAFADLNDLIELAQSLLQSLAQTVLEQCEDDLAFCNDRIDSTLLARLEQLAHHAIGRIAYTDAIHILEKSGRHFEVPVTWGIDLTSEHERFLVEEYFHAPIAVCDYPQSIKAFYMRANADGKTVAAMDILAPGLGEIIGGSQREERLDYLIARMKAVGLSPQQYSWYTDLRQYGTVPHAGFGLGFERLVGYVTGLQNIRDVIPFPRTPRHATH